MSSALNGEDLSAFTAAAREFIDWVDRGRVADMSSLHSLLARLQAVAAKLPDVSSEEEVAEPADERPAYADVVRRLAGLPLDGYAVIFNALEVPPDSVTASLADDLADIYLDLLDGFRYFDAAQVREAVWQWRFAYYSHWGRHAIHAQTALWQYLADGSAD
jgi:hypothetical protein